MDFVYDEAALREDFAPIGQILLIAQSIRLLHQAPAAELGQSMLRPEEARNFLNELYTLMRSRMDLRIYRFHGVSKQAEASMLGEYWSPTRPGLRIDNLGYESWHDTSREDSALKNSWNPMREVVEARLARGTLLFAGRVAPQQDGDRRLGGGAMQFFIPRPGHRLFLTHNHQA